MVPPALRVFLNRCIISRRPHLHPVGRSALDSYCTGIDGVLARPGRAHPGKVCRPMARTERPMSPISNLNAAWRDTQCSERAHGICAHHWRPSSRGMYSCSRHQSMVNKQNEPASGASQMWYSRVIVSMCVCAPFVFVVQNPSGLTSLMLRKTPRLLRRCTSRANLGRFD